MSNHMSSYVLFHTRNEQSAHVLLILCVGRNIFHILTIGSSKPEHELYGFHRGYIVSPHHVAESIRNFVAYFFSCDVCRTNFLVCHFIIVSRCRYVNDMNISMILLFL